MASYQEQVRQQKLIDAYRKRQMEEAIHGADTRLREDKLPGQKRYGKATYA